MRSLLPSVPTRFRQRMPNLFRAMSDMENEMDRWMQSSNRMWPQELQGFEYAPTCNLKETPKEFIVEFEVPGIKKNELKIELENQRLTVSGERKKEQEEKDEKHYLSESYYGSFTRSFDLPSAVDENKVEASYEDGVLMVRCPKSQATKTKEVKVR